MGPVYLESTTPEVFKTSFGKIPKTGPSETIAKIPFLEVTLLNKVNFLSVNQNFLLNKKYSQWAIYMIDFQYKLDLSTLIFHEAEKSKC